MQMAGFRFDARDVPAAPVAPAPGSSADACRTVRKGHNRKRRQMPRSTDESAKPAPRRRRGGDHRKHVHVPEKIVRAFAFLANFVAKAAQLVASPFRWKEPCWCEQTGDAVSVSVTRLCHDHVNCSAGHAGGDQRVLRILRIWHGRDCSRRHCPSLLQAGLQHPHIALQRSRQIQKLSENSQVEQSAA